MGLGTAVGGWKIIKTVGGNIMKIRPANGAAADLSSALTIFVASSLHFPLSTTHVVSSSILGVGASNRAKGVKWSTAQRMVITCNYVTNFSIIGWHCVLYHASILK